MKINALILLLASLILVTGCCTQRRCADKYPPVQSVNDSSSVTTVESVQERDSITYLPADSSWLIALLECDEYGKLILRQLQDYKNGKNVEVPYVSVDGNVLTVKCKVDSLAVFNHYSKHFKKEVQYRDREVKKEVRVNYLTDFQKNEIKGFYIASFLLLLIGSAFIYKITL